MACYSSGYIGLELGTGASRTTGQPNVLGNAMIIRSDFVEIIGASWVFGAFLIHPGSHPDCGKIIDGKSIEVTHPWCVRVFEFAHIHLPAQTVLQDPKVFGAVKVWSVVSLKDERVCRIEIVAEKFR